MTDDEESAKPRPTIRIILARILDSVQDAAHHLGVIATAEAKAISVRIGIGSALFVVALIGISFALLFLSLAAWWGLGLLIGNAWSGLVVGVAWILIAVGLVIAGAKVIGASKGFPETSAAIHDISEQLRSDGAVTADETQPTGAEAPHE